MLLEVELAVRRDELQRHGGFKLLRHVVAADHLQVMVLPVCQGHQGQRAHVRQDIGDFRPGGRAGKVAFLGVAELTEGKLRHGKGLHIAPVRLQLGFPRGHPLHLNVIAMARRHGKLHAPRLLICLKGGVVAVVIAGKGQDVHAVLPLTIRPGNSQRSSPPGQLRLHEGAVFPGEHRGIDVVRVQSGVHADSFALLADGQGDDLPLFIHRHRAGQQTFL